MKFRHVLDRHGLWAQVRHTPPHDEFGPLVNLGLFQFADWNGNARTHAFIRRAGKRELAVFIGFLAAIGERVVARGFDRGRLFGKRAP